MNLISQNKSFCALNVFYQPCKPWLTNTVIILGYCVNLLLATAAGYYRIDKNKYVDKLHHLIKL